VPVASQGEKISQNNFKVAVFERHRAKEYKQKTGPNQEKLVKKSKRMKENGN